MARLATCSCRSTSRPHPLFGRKGNDLTTRVAVTFAEAALGADIAVPTLDGSPVTLRIKAGTQPGSRHRVKGKGIAAKKGTGDLIVTIDVAVPTQLSEQERTAIEQLAAAAASRTRETTS